MTIKMSKSKTVMFIITVFLSAVFVQGYFIILPIANILYEIFPDNTVLINFFLSGDFLVITFASILVTRLCRIFSKRNLMFIGGLISAAAGINMMAVENPLFMCGMKIIFAVGVSIISVCGIAVLAEVYSDDEKTYGTLLGFYNASLAIFGAVLSAIAGNLASISYKTVFMEYWILVPVALLFMFFIPKIKPKAHLAQEQTTKKEKLGKQFWWVLINFIVFNYCFSVIQFFVSVYVTENSLGAEAYAGYFNTASLVGGGVSCILFGLMHQKLGTKLIIGYYSIMAPMLLLLCIYPHKAMALIASFLIGASYGGAFAYNFAYCPSVVPKTMMDTAIGYLTAGYSLAYFSTTYIVTWTMNLMRTPLLTPTLAVPAVVAVAVTVSQVLANKTSGVATEQPAL